MLEIIAYTSGILGVIASLIEILQFFKILNVKHKVYVFIFICITTIICFSTWLYIDKTKETEKILKLQENYLKEDASLTTDGITITGSDNAGDFLSNLIQITAFYGRHPDRFKYEYENYKKQVENWSKIISDKKEKNQFIYSSDYRELEGLVISGQQNIEQHKK